MKAALREEAATATRKEESGELLPSIKILAVLL
jgi:hypothetical protein